MQLASVIAARQCQGLESIWCSLATASFPPPRPSWAFAWVPAGRLPLGDEQSRTTALEPLLPPPRA